jgi:hypothetical protein
VIWGFFKDKGKIMNVQQPEALRLADALEQGTYLLSAERESTASELRRLHSVNAELLEALKKVVGHIQWREKIQGCLGTFEEVLPEAEAAIAKAQE